MEPYLDEWSDLETYLKDLVTRLRADCFRLLDSNNVQLLPYVDNVHSWERIEEASRAFRQSFGVAFTVTSGDRPYLHGQTGNSFIAQPLLGAYTLLIAFPSDVDIDNSGCLSLLEQARPMLCELIRRLPPLDGGPRALSQVLRRNQGGGR